MLYYPDLNLTTFLFSQSDFKIRCYFTYLLLTPTHPRPTHPLTSLTHSKPEFVPAETYSFSAGNNFWRGIGPLVLRSACQQPETIPGRSSRKQAPYIEIGPLYHGYCSSSLVLLLIPFYFPSFALALSISTIFLTLNLYYCPYTSLTYYISIALVTPLVKGKGIKTYRKKISASKKVQSARKNGFNDNVTYINNSVIYWPLNP